MDNAIAQSFRPVAAPRVIENSFTEDQHQRLLKVVQDHGPWTLILSQHFKTPEEVIATTSGSIPPGFKPTWDMFLSPVFRGYLGKGGACLYPEIEDCHHNPKFLELVRQYWGAKYAEPESMLFNLQGPCAAGGAPHIDATRFRGCDMHNTPVWLLNTMAKSQLFRRWQDKKAQVISWYYKGKIGGGFHYWPDGPSALPQTIQAPMWGRAVVVENEMMYHNAQSNGPSSMRRPQGLDIGSVIRHVPGTENDWQIANGGQVIQTIPAEEMRLLIHWGGRVFMDLEDLTRTLDHTDDLTHEMVFDTFIADLRKRGETFEMPTDPINDPAFIGLLTRIYDPGMPVHMPAEPQEDIAA